ncbi:MAG TPA: HNH endonuclease signature motif containing protein [Longimicrobiales bacterium]|nr:HNH endonuclease signature motif containing protein [Longimicrobiales bacterium]
MFATAVVRERVERAYEAEPEAVSDGCGSRFTDVHHVRHWADGGKTSLDNTILLCPHHHRLLHEGGFHLEMNPWPGGRPVFDRSGIPVPERPPEPRGLSDRPVEALVRENERRGVRPDHATATARYAHAEDVPVEIWAGALEALDGATSG